MTLFISSMAIIAIFVLLAIVWILKKRKHELVNYACKQYCELHHFKWIADSVKPCKQADYDYQFDYTDKRQQRQGWVRMYRGEIKEIIFDKRSLDPREDNPLFKSANEINNVLQFPKKH